ncbi:rRNA maturation RNase YbeY [Pseudoneobacillus rhizosphaerae]|jgi:probable rRNA maturation factor|uniref:Endoribonuclease YbeY n=1 Tax=Pseudoneobacillus rhizosphaerae TaxID=2880968 RepID=A0A9C7G8V8_9BACI|nr:rRNA maturation RNase YbeY [Pseudoneobacillus rhizosphaerae]CAG9608119.1 Endoribonuclease YbeY [Pseudoneobacillus rhizosphaerae]
MTLVIDSNDETNSLNDNELIQIENILAFASKKQNVEQGSEISITFVTNESIQEINREYRQKDYPTDVISFAMEELGEGEVEVVGVDMPRILGDIIISIPKAKEQAEEYGHSFMRELSFLAVHGFLHLLGYDHETEEDEKEMFSLQREILDDYGLKR